VLYVILVFQLGINDDQQLMHMVAFLSTGYPKYDSPSSWGMIDPSFFWRVNCLGLPFDLTLSAAKFKSAIDIYVSM
jgi:hypothetical protein